MGAEVSDREFASVWALTRQPYSESNLFISAKKFKHFKKRKGPIHVRTQSKQLYNIYFNGKQAKNMIKLNSGVQKAGTTYLKCLSPKPY